MQGGWSRLFSKDSSLDQTSREESSAHPPIIQPPTTSNAIHQSVSSQPLTAKQARAQRRQALLEQALLSRANAVTGERRCLGCGRPFNDISRLAQHLADAHGGFNRSSDDVNSSHLPSSSTKGGYLLGDVLQKSPPQQQQQQQQASHRPPSTAKTSAATKQTKKQHTLKPASTSLDGQVHNNKVPLLLQPPPGTRLKKKKKPSKLKRGFMNSKASRAMDQWFTVASEVEAGLQDIDEVIGSIVNQIQMMPPSFVADIDLLEEEYRQALVIREQLLSAHEAARQRLVQAQNALLGDVGGGGTTNDSNTEESIDQSKLETSNASTVEEPTNGALLGQLEGQQSHADIPSILARRSDGHEDTDSNPNFNDKQEAIIPSSSSSSTGSNTASSSSLSSDGSFGLQWSNTLLDWAHTQRDAFSNYKGKKKKQSKGQQQPSNAVQQQPAPKPTSAAVVALTIPTEKQVQNVEVTHEDRAETEKQQVVNLKDLPEGYLLPVEADTEKKISETKEEYTNLTTIGNATTERSLQLLSLNDALSEQGGSIPFESHYKLWRCQFCDVEVYSAVSFKEHLASSRHASKVKALAAAALKPNLPSTSLADLATGQTVNKKEGEGESSSTKLTTKQQQDKNNAANTSTSQKRYTGYDADVEEYVDHIITPDINTRTIELLQKLLGWQERAKQMNATNAMRKRRLVSGMREVAKAARNGKAKAIIAAPNIASIVDAKGVSACPLSDILEGAKSKHVPVVFALSRQKLGKVLGARKSASAFAILDISGAEQDLKQLLELTEQGRQQFVEWKAINE